MSYETTSKAFLEQLSQPHRIFANFSSPSNTCDPQSIRLTLSQSYANIFFFKLDEKAFRFTFLLATPSHCSSIEYPYPLPATLYRKMRHLVGRGKTKKYGKSQRGGCTSERKNSRREQKQPKKKKGKGEKKKKIENRVKGLVFVRYTM